MFDAKKGAFDTVTSDYHSANVVKGGRKKWAPLSTRHKSFMNRRSVQQIKKSNSVIEEDIKLQEIETQRSISQVKELFQSINKFIQSSPKLHENASETYLKPADPRAKAVPTSLRRKTSATNLEGKVQKFRARKPREVAVSQEIRICHPHVSGGSSQSPDHDSQGP